MANESDEIKHTRQYLFALIEKCATCLCSRYAKKVAALLLTLLFASSAEARFNEDEVRAAYLFHIIKYIEWPKSDKQVTDKSVSICVLFNKPQRSNHSVFQLQGKESVKGILNVIPLDQEKPKNGCEILYVEKLDKRELMASIEKYGHAKTLIVTSEEQTFYDVAMVGLLRVKDNIRIFVNLPRALAKEFHFSSQLLEVAEVTK